tara:strand:- start:1343 stop:2311 length:969 start_codon:yes stop_codon:yes gene_type:complete
MIVTCPSCDTKYEVLRDILIPNGRRLRCVRCKHTWTERPPDDEASSEEFDDDIEVPSLDEINQSSGVSRGKPSSDDDYDEDEDEYEDEGEGEGEDEDEDEDEVDSPKKGKKKRGLIGRIVKLLVLISLICVIILALLLNRGRILEIWPPSKSFFELSYVKKIYKYPLFKKLYDLPYVDIGNIDSISSGGLYIAPPIPTEQIIDSVSNLVVTGIVENQSSIRLQVPSILQVVILDNNQKEIIISDFPSPVEDLGSGSNFEYEFVIADIPSEINNILVRFKVNDQNVNVEDEKKDEQIENNKSQASSGRKINKEKAAKLKKVFE